MASAASSSRAATADVGDSTATLRSVVSLLIFIHFFCVFVVLSSTFRRSELQARLVTIFGPYTEALNLDPGYYTPYYYSLGRPGDNDAVIAVDLYADGNLPVQSQTALKTIILPGDGGSRWLEGRRRYFALGKRLAAYADPEDEADALSGELARGVGARLMRETGARRAVVRCVRRLNQPLDLATLFPNFPRDNPSDPAYDEEVYAADVWIDEDNEVQVLRRARQAEVAPRRTAPPTGGRGAPAPGVKPATENPPQPPANPSSATPPSALSPPAASPPGAQP
jgi:hypothetical protein